VHHPLRDAANSRHLYTHSIEGRFTCRKRTISLRNVPCCTGASRMFPHVREYGFRFRGGRRRQPVAGTQAWMTDEKFKRSFLSHNIIGRAAQLEEIQVQSYTCVPMHRASSTLRFSSSRGRKLHIEQGSEALQTFPVSKNAGDRMAHGFDCRR
jgi:hypothetical protein